MTSSLAEQLQKLALPQTKVFKKDQKRPSILFDPKEAAGIRRETYYQIGLQGLEELILKNPVFEPFRNTLFNNNSKSFERSVHDKEANQKLDKEIEKLLFLLSPYFLLNSAHKVLEWLVYRYMINDFNRNELIMLILPYHESNIFIRVVQIFEFKNANDPLYFLKALQKPGVHLSKQNLLNHIATNIGFFKLISDFLPRIIDVHDKPAVLTVIFNFYCTTFCGAIEYRDKITEDQVSHMLPLLLKGLKSKIPDFAAASYIIVARLTAKCTLSDKLLSRFLELISKIKCNSLKTECCLTLVIIYQSQKQYLDIPSEALLNLCELEWFPKCLQYLCSMDSNIDSLGQVLMKRATEEGVNNDMKLARELVNNLLKEVEFGKEFIKTFLCSFLDVLDKQMKYSEEIKLWITDVIQDVERKFPSVFDETVKTILISNNTKMDRRRKSCLQNILRKSLVHKGRLDVLEKLYHPLEAIRAEAVNSILTNYKNLKPTDLEFIKNILLDILDNKNPKLLIETLNLIQKMRLVDERLDIALINLLTGYDLPTKEYEEKTIIFLIIKLLCRKSNFNLKIFLVILPFVWPNSNQDLNDAKEIIKLPFFSQHSNQHFNALLKASSVKQFIDHLFKYLNSKENVMVDILEIMQQISVNDYRMQYCCAVAVSHLLSKSSLENLPKILRLLYDFYLNAKQRSFKHKSSFQDYLLITKTKFPVKGLIQCVEKLFKYINNSELDFSTLDFSRETAESSFVQITAALVFNKFELNQESVVLFLNNFCDNTPKKINVLLNLCTSQTNFLDETCIVNIVNYVSEILSNDESKNLISLDSLTTVHLLILLYTPYDTIRQGVFKIVEYIVKSCLKSDSYFHLLDRLLAHKEEIIMDHNQLPIFVGDFFNFSNRQKTKTKQIDLILSTLQNIVCNKDTPQYTKQGLVALLVDVKSYDFFEALSLMALSLLDEQKQSFTKFESLIFKCMINKIDSSIAQQISLTSNVWKMIKMFLENEQTQVMCGEEGSCFMIMILQHFTLDVLSYFPEEILSTLLDIFLKLCVTSKHPDVYTLVAKIFKHIDLDATVVIKQLTQMRDIQSINREVGKRNRKTNIPSVDILETVEWKKGNIVLEFMQNKKKLRNSQCLLTVVSDLLKRCLDFEEQAVVEYTKQLLLSLVLLICNRIDKNILSEKEFNIDLVVQCIRSSQNPQTHHHAMLVLAYLAEVFPEKVLHHIMSIFTFMGSSLLRHDDAYSFQIIMKIVDIVVPIFLQSNQLDDLTKVLRVFVDALLDVPEHRRIPLYKQLLQNINPEENMYLFMLLIFDSHVLQHGQDKRKVNKGVDNMRLDITRTLCCEFPPTVTLLSCMKVIKFLKDFPVENPENKEHTRTNESSMIVNIVNYTSKQLRHYKYTGITFISNLLSSKSFVNQIANQSTEDLLGLEKLFKEVIINILTFIQTTSKTAEKSVNTPQAQYWKIILHHSFDILDGVNALLTPHMFLLVEKGLLVYNLLAVRRRALELLNAKLHNNLHFFSECDKKDVYVLIPIILSIVATIDNEEQIDSETEVLIQTALLSLKLFIKAFSSKDPEKFVEILKFVTNILVSGKAQNNVLASVLLCLAELCVDLKAYAISCLADFMPAFLKILKSQKHQETSNLLLLSVITTTQKLVESLPLFLSPYLNKILFEVSILISRWNCDVQNQKLQLFLNKLNGIKQKIGHLIPLRVLLPSVASTYENLLQKKYWKALNPFMDILQENLKNTSGLDIKSNLPELTNFFLNALEFRSESANSEEAHIVEQEVIKTLLVVVLKLSESTFRPLFYKIYDWASHDDKRAGKLITFYNLSKEIANSLKSLFVLFAGHFITNAIQILDYVNKTKNEQSYYKDDDKDALLLQYVLETLQAIFKFDNHKFINKDRFDLIMQPLVDQLENCLGDVDKFLERNEKLLTPTIVQFVLATAEDSVWKQANYQILLKMRNPMPQIRLAALHCLTQVVIKLGEDFLPLLPETIPFLAELLEDEDENVEKACQKAVQEMEKILGEPLQKYF